MEQLLKFLIEIIKDNSALSTGAFSLIVGVIVLREAYPVLEKILKNSGIWKDSSFIKYQSSIDDLKNTVSYHVQNIDDSTSNLLTMLKILEEKQNSYLTNNQVDVAIKLTFMYVQRELTFKFLDVVNINNDPIGAEHDIKRIFETVIKNVDRYFFQLPNTKGKILPTEEKIACFYNKEFGFLDDIIKIIYSDFDSDQKRIKLELILIKLTDYWYQTQ